MRGFLLAVCNCSLVLRTKQFCQCVEPKMLGIVECRYLLWLSVAAVVPKTYLDYPGSGSLDRSFFLVNSCPYA